MAAAEAPSDVVHNQAINVGQTTENYRISELAEIVVDVVPNSRLEFAPDAGPDKRNYRVDCSKIERIMPNFKPQWTARKGAEQLLEAYRKVGIQADEFEGPRYRRIHHIKQLIANGEVSEDLRWQVTETI